MGDLLLVDDDEDIRTLLAIMLKRKGYQVRQGENGAECLSLARKCRPALILLNFLMPVMDGLEALAELRKDPALSHMKVVLYSAHGDWGQFRIRALELGALDCIPTPNMKTLLKVVEKGLRSR